MIGKRVKGGANEVNRRLVKERIKGDWMKWSVSVAGEAI